MQLRAAGWQHTETPATRRRTRSNLCSDPCVVTARNPQHSVALHPSPGGHQREASGLQEPSQAASGAESLPSDQRVFHRHSQGVAHVQRPGHIRWRNAQGEGLVHSVG